MVAREENDEDFGAFEISQTVSTPVGRGESEIRRCRTKFEGKGVLWRWAHATKMNAPRSIASASATIRAELGPFLKKQKTRVIKASPVEGNLH